VIVLSDDFMFSENAETPVLNEKAQFLRDSRGQWCVKKGYSMPWPSSGLAVFSLLLPAGVRGLGAWAVDGSTGAPGEVHHERGASRHE
jgi:hypothetical protein